MGRTKRLPRQGRGNAADGQMNKTDMGRLLSGRKVLWIIAAVYLVITIILFHEFLFSDGMLFGNDTIPDGIYTRSYYKDYHAEYGGVPRWNPFVLGGLPFIDAMHGDTFYPGAWLKFFMPLTRALGHKLIWHVLLAGLTMFLFLRTLGLRRDASFVGGVMYMTAPSFVTLLYPGHDAKMYVIALLPLAFTFLERGMKKADILSFSGLGGIMGLLVLTSHIQMAYYSYWAIGLYFIARIVVDRTDPLPRHIKRIALFIGAVVLAVGLGAVQLLPSYAFTTKYSVRAGAERTGYDYATSWSLHPEEIGGLVVPSFQGYRDGREGRQIDLYWGRNPFKLNTEYCGILPLLFGILGLVYLRDRMRWYYLVISLLSIVYALGATTPLYRLFYHLVPGVKNFRAPSMIIFLFCFAAVALASAFLSRLLDRDSQKSSPLSPKLFLYIIAGAVGTAFVLSVMNGPFFDLWRSVLYRDISEQAIQALTANRKFFIGDLWRVTIMVCAAAGGVWMFLTGRIGALALAVLLALTALIDGSVVDARFITVIDPVTYPATAPDAVVPRLKEKLAADGPFRTLGLVSVMAGAHQSSNYYAMFGIPVADGAHNNELQSYELFKGGRTCLNFFAGWLGDNFNPDGIPDNNFLKVAGVKEIVVPGENRRMTLIHNDAAFDRVFIVHDWVTVPDDTAAVALLRDTSFDPARKVILVNEPGGPVRHDVESSGSSSVLSLEYTKYGAEISAELAAPGFIVLTDNYVPYWHATLDGKPVELLQAYGTFMALPCNAGRHNLAITYHSPPFETGKRLTLASLGTIFLLMSVSGLGRYVRKMRTTA